MNRQRQLFATLVITWGFFTLGMLIASFGPSLIEFTRQTGASAAMLTLALTARSCGYLLGSILGGVLLDWAPPHGNTFIAISMLMTCTATACIPYVGSVGALSALVTTQGAAMGTLDTIGNVLLLYLHGSEARPWMQGLHAFFALGTLCAPLLVRASMEMSASGTSIAGAYFIFAACAGFGALLFMVTPTPPPRATATQKLLTETGEGTQNEAAAPGLIPGAAWKIIAVTSALLGLYVGAETGFGGFLILYSTTGRSGLSEAQGQFLTAVYWGALTLGRFLAIPLSLLVSVSNQLLGDIAACLLAVGLLGLGIAVDMSLGTVLLWTGAAIYGLGMASVFPSAFMQAEALVDLNGRAASVLMVGAAFGEMVIPLAVGFATTDWPEGFVLIISLTTAAFSLASLYLVLQKPRQTPHQDEGGTELSKASP